jgi:hypothetical protein
VEEGFAEYLREIGIRTRREAWRIIPDTMWFRNYGWTVDWRKVVNLVVAK